MARERRRVAARFGVRELPDTASWLDTHAGAPAGEAARPVPDLERATRLIRCAVIGSLVPLISAAELAERDAPVTRAMAGLVQAALGGDIENAGRRLDTIGIGMRDLDDARRRMDAIAGGAR